MYFYFDYVVTVLFDKQLLLVTNKIRLPGLPNEDTDFLEDSDSDFIDGFADKPKKPISGAALQELRATLNTNNKFNNLH